MDNAELAIGIDLGTTNSLIAVWKDGAAQLIPNKFGEYLTPSIISMDENNHILVGKPAVSRRTSHPDKTAALFKRAMGNDSNLLIVFYVQIMPDDFVMQLHRF